MKTRLTIAFGVMTALLFVLVPNAAPKGKPGGGGGGSGTFSVTGCVSDGTANGFTCTFSPVTGLSKSLRYRVEVSSLCSGPLVSSNYTPAQLAAGATIDVPDTDLDTCAAGSNFWTFDLWSSTTKTPIVPTLIGSAVVADTN